MVAVYYDSNGSILYKNPLAWNINNVKVGQTLKITSTSPVKDTPSKLELWFFDHPFNTDDNDAIFKVGIILNDSKA